MATRVEYLAALIPLVDLLHRLGVTWYVGGSVASTVHGHFRATNDVDLIADVRAEHAEALRVALDPDHYVDEDSIRDAVRRRPSFNLLHFRTGLKIDVFVAADPEYEASVRARRVLQAIDDGPSARHLWTASAEDTILAKLAGYRRGGEVSDRQWSDVQGVMELRDQDLDIGYLRQWAPELGVADLLERALTEARK